MAKLPCCFDIALFYIRISIFWNSHAKGLPLQAIVKDNIDAFHKLQKSRHYFKGVPLHPPFYCRLYVYKSILPSGNSITLSYIQLNSIWK